MPKDQWIVKNKTSRYLSVGDLQKLPAIWPGKVLNVLNYYGQDSISNSFDLKFMINKGWLTLTKIKNGEYTSHTSADGQGAITTAEKNEIDNVASSSSEALIMVSSSSYTIDPDNDRYVYVDASDGSVTVNLPTAESSDGKGIFHIKKTDSSANTVTIDGNGSETINGNTTAVIELENEVISIASDGTEWHII